MERIFLNHDQKEILFSLNKNSDPSIFMESWERGRKHYAIEDLIIKNLVTAKYYEDTDYIDVRFTSFGREYLLFNPKLKNPLSEKDIERKNFWTSIKGQVLTHCIILVIGYLLGYITKEYANNKYQDTTKPIVEIQEPNGNMVIDTIVIGTKVMTDGLK